MARSDVGERGKWAEKEVSKALSTCARTDLAFHRMPDARAGSMKATLADFLLLVRGTMILLEVKEVNHSFRIPHGNFDKDKVARMRRFQLAGARSIVVMYFKPEDKWRCAPLDFFLTREGGSWDMRPFELQPLSNIINVGTHPSHRLILGHI